MGSKGGIVIVGSNGGVVGSKGGVVGTNEGIVMMVEIGRVGFGVFADVVVGVRETRGVAVTIGVIEAGEVGEATILVGVCRSKV